MKSTDKLSRLRLKNWIFEMEKFDENTKKALESYVYALVDPRTNEPFYIGKGEGNRVFSHVNGSEESIFVSEKIKQIQDIQTDGFDVK